MAFQWKWNYWGGKRVILENSMGHIGSDIGYLFRHFYSAGFNKVK